MGTLTQPASLKKIRDLSRGESGFASVIVDGLNKEFTPVHDDMSDSSRF